MTQEIHYCDKCGDVMQGNFDAHAQALCMRCQGSRPQDSAQMGMTSSALTITESTKTGLWMVLLD